MNWVAPLPSDRNISALGALLLQDCILTTEIDMLKKTIMLAGTVASLVIVSANADAQAFGRRGYCEDYARRVAYRSGDTNSDANRVVGSAVTGAILGGAVGALTGNGHASNIGTGIAVGGVTGGLVGASTPGHRYNRGAFDQAFWNCMHQSNFRTYDQPVRYSRGVQFCASRYQSYDPATGLYLSSSGRYRHCP